MPPIPLKKSPSHHTPDSHRITDEMGSHGGNITASVPIIIPATNAWKEWNLRWQKKERGYTDDIDELRLKIQLRQADITRWQMTIPPTATRNAVIQDVTRDIAAINERINRLRYTRQVERIRKATRWAGRTQQVLDQARAELLDRVVHHFFLGIPPQTVEDDGDVLLNLGLIQADYCIVRMLGKCHHAFRDLYGITPEVYGSGIFDNHTTILNLRFKAGLDTLAGRLDFDDTTIFRRQIDQFIDLVMRDQHAHLEDLCAIIAVRAASLWPGMPFRDLAGGLPALSTTN